MRARIQRLSLHLAALLFLWSLLAACSNSDGVFQDKPRLISEVTLPPVTFAPTRILSPTPTVAETEPTAMPPVFTRTASDFVLVTPTLPPSKTPTITPTVTQTLTVTPTAPASPTRTPVAQEIILLPTQVIVPPEAALSINLSATAPVAPLSQPQPTVPVQPQAACTAAQWFFIRPVPPDCPPNPPLTSAAAYQGFEFGFMVWIEVQDAIYVFYDSADSPRWQVFPDTFVEGMPETDPMLDTLAPPYADWQPRRGFGVLWRGSVEMRDRIGWAESPYENSYTVSVQTANDGTIYMSGPYGRVFVLAASGLDWELYNNGF